MNSGLAILVKNWPEDGFSYVFMISEESAKTSETNRNLMILFCFERLNKKKLLRKNIFKIHSNIVRKC